MGTLRAILYPRVSSLRQVDGTSLDLQERECRRWCEDHDHAIAETFIERGESAKTADRTKLLAALEYVREHKIDAFVVWKIDRFARSSRDYHVLQDTLASIGCRLVSVTEPLEDSPSGRFLGSIMASVAQLDNEVRAERSRAGMLARARQGCWCWVPPLGYVPGKTLADHPTLIPDPVLGPVVTRLFELFAGGHCRQTDLVRVATEQGLLTRKGHRPLGKQSIRQLLQSPVYAGWIVSRMTGAERIRGNWQPLIDQETWDLVQGLLQDGPQKGRQHVEEREEFGLKGFLYCPSCDRALTASWARGSKGKRYAYYHCPRCRGSNVSQASADALFGELLRESAWTEFRVALFDRHVHATLQAFELARREAHAAREAATRALRRQAEQLLDLRMAHEIDAKTFADRNGQIQVALAGAVMSERDSAEGLHGAQATIAFANRLLADPLSVWREAPAHAKRLIQGFFFSDGLILATQQDGVRTLITRGAATSNAQNALETTETPARRVRTPQPTSPPTPSTDSAEKIISGYPSMTECELGRILQAIEQIRLAVEAA